MTAPFPTELPSIHPVIISTEEVTSLLEELDPCKAQSR